MGAFGKRTKQAHIVHINEAADRLKRVNTYDDITPYQLERLHTGEFIETSEMSPTPEPAITHGDTNLVVGYKIEKGKGNSYTIRFRQGQGGAYTSSVKVTKAGLESYLKKMKRASSITYNCDDQIKFISR